MQRTTTFSRGSACYACTSCERMTRDDGHRDSVHVRQCSQCYELGGLENMISDSGLESLSARDAEQIRGDVALIASRGGKASVWADLMDSVAEAFPLVAVAETPVVELAPAAPAAALRQFEVRADFGTSIISYLVWAADYNGAKKAGRAAHRAAGHKRSKAIFTAYKAPELTERQLNELHGV